ncbi:MAG: acyl-CoA thioesterase [Syntrophobacteraceae bacterium]
MKNQIDEFGLPIVSAACDFLKPVRYGEKLRLTVSLSSIRNKSLFFDFRFYRLGEQDLVARGNATMVARRADWRSRTIPERIRMAVSKEGLLSRARGCTIGEAFPVCSGACVLPTTSVQ